MSYSSQPLTATTLLEAAGWLALAQLSLDAGDAKGAEPEAREGLERFRALRLSDGEAAA